MAFDILDDIKPLILSAIPTLINAQIAAEFPDDTDDAEDTLFNSIAVTHIQGRSPIHTFGGGQSRGQKPLITRPSFKILIRHLDETTIHEWWDAIKTALDGLTDYQSNGRTYIVIYQVGDIIDLGRDKNRRHLHALQFDTEIINAY